MSETDAAPLQADRGSERARFMDLGVVDPIRLPDLAPVRARWSRMPQLGRAFVLLAAADVLVRSLGLFGTSLFLDPALPLTWLTAFLPHDALILLPAAIASRRPNALLEVPLLTGGAIAVALVEALREPVGGLLGSIAGDPVVVPVLVGLVALTAGAAGWLAIGRGLRTAVPTSVSQSTAGLANLVGGALTGAALVSAAAAFMSNRIDVGEPSLTALLRVHGAVLGLSGLGFAYFAWVVVRTSDDPGRPVTARRLGTVAVAGLAAGAVLGHLAGPGLVWTVAFLLTFTAAWTALVVAFALGLAGVPDEVAPPPPEDEGPSWPDPESSASWPRPQIRPIR